MKVPWRAARGARREFAQGQGQLLDAGDVGMRLGQLLHQPAEGVFAVGVAHRMEAAVQPGPEVLEVAVVGEDPVAAPQFAHEGMAILERDLPLRGLADMGNDVGRLDRVTLDQFGDRRGDRGLVVDEMAHAGALEEGDAPAIVVGIGAAAAVGETGEGKHNVSRDIAVHCEELAHGEELTMLLGYDEV